MSKKVAELKNLETRHFKLTNQSHLGTLAYFTYKPQPVFTKIADLFNFLSDELKEWEQALEAWRQQNWDRCLAHLEKLQRKNAKKVLYRLYAERVVSMRVEPPPPDWDGSTAFDTK